MRKLFALLAVCCAVAACDTRLGAGSVTSPFTGELGTFILESSSGELVPITLQPQAPNTVRKLVAETLFVTSGGNMRDVFYTSTTTNGSTAPPVISSVSLAGKYRITRDSISVPADFPYTYGRYSGGTITMNDAQGFTWVFKRK
jgi:hypothetical protein